MNKPPDGELTAALKALTNALPDGTEIKRLLSNVDDPARDEASKDRYVALVATSTVEHALKIAIGRHLAPNLGSKEIKGFDTAIKRASALEIVSREEAADLNHIRDIRNAFAHAVGPISFTTPVVAKLTRQLFHHPITDWDSYFAPIFAARVQFALVCGEFYKKLAT